MELPIAKESYEPTTEVLVRAAKRARVTLANAIAQQTELDGATALTSPDRPGIRCANFAADMTALHDDLFTHFQERGASCHVLQCATQQWPDDLADRARQAGYFAKSKSVLLLRHYQSPPKRNEQLQILPARSIYPQLRSFYEDFARQGHGLTGECVDHLASAMIDLLDEPQLELFVGRLDKTIAGAAGVVSLGNIGVINAAYTHMDYRGQGVAASLMAATIEHCSRAQFEQVIIDRSVGCESIPFYESLGFQCVAGYDQYMLK